MKLRKSKALKMFAVLLFSLEMMAPAMISFANSDGRFDVGQTAFVNLSHLPGLFTSLVFEESGEEETEFKDHKSAVGTKTFDFHQASIALEAISFQKAAWQAPHETTATQPLFTLFHTYLI